MKYTSVSPRISRKCGRGYKRSLDVEETDPSEHSSDSGLGLDHQTEVQVATRGIGKRPLAYAFEEESNAEFCFPSMPGRGRGPVVLPVNLSTPLAATSRDGRAVLAIVSQPEQQHRARYQTEGSRGAVKDRTGNGFPIVKLSGYNKPTTLQIFVGTDVGRVAPHMFYQACRVSGKNSTPCIERKVEGTVVIEVDLDPSKDMIVTCDCVGILKERNVDVEHRFPEQTAARSKKKSTRCRMVFRAAVVNVDGSTEVLQVCSQQIVCTQPPGIPEICKRSLTSCLVTGGVELFVLGKNFLKDTRLVFQSSDVNPQWEEAVLPDKEFLQQNHLVCVVPPYRTLDITEPVTVKMFITSSGKASDPHNFVYMPLPSHHGPTPMEIQPCSSYFPGLATSAFINGNRGLAKACNAASIDMDTNCYEPGKKSVTTVWASATKPEACDDDETMLPPPPALIPLARHHMITDREEFKAEAMEEMSQHSMSCDRESSLSPSDMQGVDLSMKPPLLRHLVDISLPNNPFLKTEPSQQFPTLYENEPQILEEALLRPPPSKILARSFAEGNSFQADGEAGNESQQAGLVAGRVRSGSFSHSSPIHDNSMSGYESFSRVRSASMSHTFDRSSFFSQATPISLSNGCSFKEVDNAMSAVVKQAAEGMQSNFFGVQSTSAPEILAHPQPCINNELPSTRALDAMVNSAVDSHMSPIQTAAAPAFVQQISGQPELSAVAEEAPVYAAVPFEASAPVEPTPVPVTVSEISRSSRLEMMVPPGPAPPITGMVPQEMVKMTDNDLISYINPSCFDQV